MIVLDASVIIKWFVQEEDSDTALQFKEQLLHGDEEIAVPDLLIYELTNALRFKKGVTEEAITAITPSLFHLGFEIITPTEKLIRDALHVSFMTDLSIYDAIYLALANELNVSCIIADARILRQAVPFAKVQGLISKK